MKAGERAIHRCTLSAVTTLRIKAQITPLKFSEMEQLSDRGDNLLVQRSFYLFIFILFSSLACGVCSKRKASYRVSGLAMKANGAPCFKRAIGRALLCLGIAVSPRED
ncbi:hypothetical protein QQF64_008773 [Cirrhinus molitorella]|uniref:Uncharacterized protein n=1 Tax=Cirrhinus molitorella TaxID=172907 RepID=A0ABR3M758_9TELE